MDMFKKMEPVRQEVKASLNAGGDGPSASEAIVSAAHRWNLDRDEVQHLCRQFGILTEDLRWNG